MRSSFKKLRGFALAFKPKSSPESAALDPPSPDVDPMKENMQVVEEMKQQYDNLLALAQTISAASFDFSNSIGEIMSCMLGMLEKSDDEETVGVVNMLAKVQYEISKLLKIYGAHVSETIVRPTENLLQEIQSIEEIKRQFEEERKQYNQINALKGKGKNNKSDLPEGKLSSVKERMARQSMQFDIRFKSLKHGQELSLVTQAIRHYTAQCLFFNKSLDSLNAVDDLVKNVSERLCIDRTLDYDNLEVGIADDDESTPRTSKVEKLETDSHSTYGMQRMYANSSKSAPLQAIGTKNGTTTVDFMLQKLPQKKREDATDTKYVLPNPSIANIRTHNQPTVRFGTNEVQIIETDPFDKSDPYEKERSHSSCRSPRHVVGASVDFSYMQEMDNTSHMPAYSHSGPLPSKYGHSGPLQSKPQMQHKQRIERNNMVDDGAWQSNNHHHNANSNNKTRPWGGYTSPPPPPPPPPLPPRISPTSSPMAAPASDSSAPIISELHKLPTPPQKGEPLVPFSAPLGRNDIEVEQIPEEKTLSQKASIGIVKKSRSIPASVAFPRNLQHSSSFNDSPIIELPQ